MPRTSNILVRTELPRDAAAVGAVNDAAFGQPDEGRLVEAMRGSPDMLLSLVTAQEEAVLGHVFFTRVRVHDERGSWLAAALGPVAVHPDHQRRGIGSSLVRDGLRRLDAMKEHVVFVLGLPEYYPRFGFRPTPPLGLRCEWDVPDDVFMVAELRAQALDGRRGLVRYAEAFRRLT